MTYSKPEPVKQVAEKLHKRVKTSTSQVDL